MNLHYSRKDVVALVTVTLLSGLANLPEGYGGWLLNRNLVLGALIATVVIALFHYLQAVLLVSISMLAIGANLPREMAEGLGVSQTAMIVFLALLIGLTLANRVLHLLPVNAHPDDADEFDPENTLLLEGAQARMRMMEAIAHGKVATLHRLLSTGTPVNFKMNGATPLHLATEKGYSGIVQVLIDHGADLLAQNAEGQTPLDLAFATRKYAKTMDTLYKATVPLLSGGQMDPEAGSPGTAAFGASISLR